MVWIGAQLVRGPRRRGVAEKKVTIPGEKMDKIKHLGEQRRSSSGMIDKNALRRLQA